MEATKTAAAYRITALPAGVTLTVSTDRFNRAITTDGINFSVISYPDGDMWGMAPNSNFGGSERVHGTARKIRELRQAAFTVEQVA